MLVGPDWNKLYAAGNCLYYGVPFTDEQWVELNKAASTAKREELVRKFREEYMKNRDLVTGEVLKTAEIPEEKEEVVEEETKEEVEEVELSIEDVKPAKSTKKKGK